MPVLIISFFVIGIIIIFASIALASNRPALISRSAVVVSLTSLICFILVVVKMFRTAGVVQGIIGLICGIWAFIWGWMNAGKLGIKNIMLIWTVLIILSMVLNIVNSSLN